MHRISSLCLRGYIFALTLLANPLPVLADFYSDAVLKDGPLAYWRLGETTGAMAFDSSGFGRDATYSGPTLGCPGALEGCIDTSVFFDSDRNDRIQRTDSAGLCPGLGSWTVEAWVRTPLLAHDRPMVDWYPGGHFWGIDDYYGLWVDSHGNPDWRVRDSAGACVILKADRPIDDDRWHYIVGVLDRETTVSEVYVDGGLVTSAPAMLGSISYGGTPVNVGWADRFLEQLPSTFDGYLDEVALYDTALTPAQISAHYAAANTPEPAEIVLFSAGVIIIPIARKRRRQKGIA